MDKNTVLYKLFELTPIVFSILVVTIILLTFILIYYFSIKKLKPNEAPKGFSLLIFTLINYTKQLVFDILGPEFIKITPYFLTLIGYILVSNLIGIAGIESPTATVSVTLSMGLITFFGTFVIGFKYQRLSYLKKYLIGLHVRINGQKKYIPLMINPLEIVGSFTSLISISLRLWGNMFAGGLILSLFYSIPMAIAGTMGAPESNPMIHPANKWVLIAGVFAPPINAYIDLLAGVIQTIVFVMLTMVYWTMAKSGEGDEPNPNQHISYKFVDNDEIGYVKLNNVSNV